MVVFLSSAETMLCTLMKEGDEGDCRDGSVAVKPAGNSVCADMMSYSEHRVWCKLDDGVYSPLIRPDEGRLNHAIARAWNIDIPAYFASQQRRFVGSHRPFVNATGLWGECPMAVI